MFFLKMKRQSTQYWKLVKEVMDEDNTEDPRNKISPDHGFHIFRSYFLLEINFKC